MSRKKRLASVTSAGLVFVMLLSQSSVANLGAEVVKAADDTENWLDTEYVVNGDFEAEANEDGSIAGWTLSDDFKLYLNKDQWSSNKTQFLKIVENSGSAKISQEIKNVEPGTYRVVLEQDGLENTSSGLTVKCLDSELELPATTGWDKWETVTTADFVIEDAQDITLSIEGDIPASYWGDIDNVKLQKLNETTSDDKSDSEENQEGYKISVDKTEVTVEKGEKVDLTAKVTYNGKELTEIPDGIKLWWWVDTWNDHTDGLNDGILNNDNNSGKTLKADYTTKSAGTYYVVAKLETPDGDVSSVVTITSTEPDSTGAVDNDDITVAKVKDLSSDFIMGMDISSVITEFNSGVVYKDYDGNVIDNVTDFCKFLAANGITHIRVRVWNDPYDSNGNGYGGGNNDVATAKKIADACRAAGINMLVDFHCSDFWADPSKQMVPKAWEGFTVDQKADAVEKFINESLQKIDPTKDVVDMVQVGNETTGSFIGEKNVADMCKLFSAGSNGVKTYNKDVKVVIHVESPHKKTLKTWSDNLANYNVDYDILGTSYYPYWHGTLSNLKEQIEYVQKEHNKDAMVVETSYAYTLEDSDGSGNTVREGNNDDAADATEPFTVQGQATYIRNLINAVNEAGGLGVFYWEPAWITVGDTTGLSEEEAAARYEENKKIWEKYGSGWASSYGGEYDPKDAGQWYGGSAVDNQAMFYPDGTATAGLKVWNYVKTGAIVTKIGIENIENASVTGAAGQDITLPETVNVTYNTETVAEKVTWNTEGVDLTKAGTYTVEGTVDFSKEIERGAYKGMKSATVKCTVTVKIANLIADKDDAGFEKGDNFIVSDSSVISGIPATDDPKSGVGSAHWYNGGSETTEAAITYDKEITLAAGEYTFEYVGQGADGDALYAKVVDADGNVIAQGENTVLSGWKNWKYPTVSFTLDKETSVTLVVGIVSAAGGWGTADDLYLYQTKAADASDDNNTGDNDNKNDNTNTGDNDNKNDNTNTEDNTNTDNNGSSSASSSTTTTDKTLTAGSVVSSTADSKTTIKDTKGILPATVKFDSKKVTDEKEVSKVTKAVNDKIVGVKDVAIYELNLTDGTTQIHQLADKVQVTMDMPFTLADNEAVKVFRVDGEKLVPCTSSVVDGKLVFETDHFSTFAFVKVKAGAAKTAKSAKTSDENNMYMWLVLAMAGIGVTVAAASKKKQHI
ncbi:glycosyl hydrolase 53 family protein [Agathobacter sp.]